MFNDPLPQVLPLLFPDLRLREEDCSWRAVLCPLSQGWPVLGLEGIPVQQLLSPETLQNLPALHNNTWLSLICVILRCSNLLQQNLESILNVK